MAITAPIKTSDFSGFLTPDQSAPIFNDAWKASVFQQLFRKVPLGINGQAIPVITGKPVANWVAEGAKKPATEMIDTSSMVGMLGSSLRIFASSPRSKLVATARSWSGRVTPYSFSRRL